MDRDELELVGVIESREGLHGPAHHPEEAKPWTDCDRELEIFFASPPIAS